MFDGIVPVPREYTPCSDTQHDGTFDSFPRRRIGRSLPRLALVILGFVLMVVGLGMTATIVMLPADVVLGLLGVAMFLAGIFAPDLLDSKRSDR